MSDSSNPYIGANQRLQKKEIAPLIEEEYRRGESNPVIDVLTLGTGGTAQAFYTDVRRLVRKAIIQNISVENVTIGTSKNTAIGLGIILNAATAGQGGGSMPVYNVDLTKLYFNRTTSGVTLAIYIED